VQAMIKQDHFQAFDFWPAIPAFDHLCAPGRVRARQNSRVRSARAASDLPEIVWVLVRLNDALAGSAEWTGLDFWRGHAGASISTGFFRNFGISFSFG
jgi:hypothetical protein